MNHFCFIKKTQFDLNLKLIASKSQMSLIGAFILKSYPVCVYLELDGWMQLQRSCSVSTFSCVDESSEGSAHHRLQLYLTFTPVFVFVFVFVLNNSKNFIQHSWNWSNFPIMIPGWKHLKRIWNEALCHWSGELTGEVSSTWGVKDESFAVGHLVFVDVVAHGESPKSSLIHI